VIFPAVLAVAEKTGTDGKSFLEALIVGYEIAIRAGLILQGHYGYYHGSGAWGAIGAAAAAVRLLYLNQEQSLNAIGIAESYAPLTPVMRSVASPAMAPKDGVAWGAMAGVSAALLAQRGYSGSPSVLGDPAYNRDVFDLGRVWRIMHIYFKPFPCCRWTQPAVTAVLNLLKNAEIRPEEISRIIVHTFAEAAVLSAEMPQDLESAEYNIRFPVAAAIVYGEFTAAQLAENCFTDDAVRHILELIETRIDPGIQDQFPQKCLSRVEIHTVGGRVADSGLIPARGDRDGVPFSREELETKFFTITKDLLAPDAARSLAKIIRNFENNHISDIMPYLA
jgi:2-methylcitrate dehydratase PrpD